MGSKIKIAPYECDLEHIDHSFLEEMREKGAGVVIPVYIDKKGSVRLVMVRHAGGKRRGKLDFPGGRREKGESYFRTAAREAREETCELLNIRDLDLLCCPGFSMQNTSAVFVVPVPLLTNRDFQVNLAIETETRKRPDHMEMDHLVRVPLEVFIRDYPRSGIIVEVNGKEYEITSFSAIAAFIANRKKMIDAVSGYIIGGSSKGIANDEKRKEAEEEEQGVP